MTGQQVQESERQVEQVARALWEFDCGAHLRECFPWDSDDPIAVDMRGRAFRRARVALAASSEETP